jgi:error-prone DNA polymerase
MGFKRSEARMRDIEVKLRRGMTAKGINGQTQDEIVQSIASFALYGFPESHAASFALIAYASAYLKCHYLAAFTAATLNNQPMGFYQPFTIIKDAQRHGLKVRPVDVTRSNWECTIEKNYSQWSGVRGQESRGQRSEGRDHYLDGAPRREIVNEPDTVCESRRDEIFIDEPDSKFPEAPLGAEQFRSYGASDSFLKSDSINIPPLCGGSQSYAPNPALRLGLRCVKGLRAEAGRAIALERSEAPFTSIDDLHRRVPELRKDELRKLAAAGALNFIRSTGPEGSKCNSPARKGGDHEPENHSEAGSADTAFSNESRTFGAQKDPSPEGPRPDGRGYSLSPLRGSSNRRDALWQVERVARNAGPLYEQLEEAGGSPLAPMTLNERLNADLRGTGLTIGRHPMAHQRPWLETMKVVCAAELKKMGNGMPVRVAGWVIVRQRPGTAKGFVFLSLEDETGIANVIITPQLFEQNRLTLVDYPFLLIEGALQHQDNVVSVKAKRVEPLHIKLENVGSHDFH